MNRQNDKNAFHINALTRLNDDYTEKESKIRNNHTVANYQYFRPKAINRNNYLDSVTRVGIYQNNNRDGRGMMVDNESGLFNGKRFNTLTSTGKKSINNFQHVFFLVPHFLDLDILPYKMLM